MTNLNRLTTLFTIGHSNVPMEQFLGLLRTFGVETLVDVRTMPYSRAVPHFGRESLTAQVRRRGTDYIFEGRDLGGRPIGEEFYSDDGRVLYYRVARQRWFADGLERLSNLAVESQTAIMCSEEAPSDCHRHLLIGRALEGSNVAVLHVRGDATVQPYESLPDVRKRRASDLTLFPAGEDLSWISTRSVSRNAAPRASSER